MITNSQLEILHHTAKRAAQGLYCGDSPDMQELVNQGLMESAGFKGFCPDEFFKLTKLGEVVLQQTNQNDN